MGNPLCGIPSLSLDDGAGGVGDDTDGKFSVSYVSTKHEIKNWRKCICFVGLKCCPVGLKGPGWLPDRFQMGHRWVVSHPCLWTMCWMFGKCYRWEIEFFPYLAYT